MKFWEIKNEVNTDVAQLYIYKEIDNSNWGDEEIATPIKFAKDLQELGGKNLMVHINSCGGDVFAAQAIYNQLKRYPGNVDVIIDGLAASAATIVACAGNKVTMPSNTAYLIHNPMNLLIGFYNEQELNETVIALKAVKQTIINVYKMKCKDKITDKLLTKMMDEETILTAQEAKDYGFIDEIDDNNVSSAINKGFLVVNSVKFNEKSFKNPQKIMDILNNKGVKSMSEIKKSGGIIDKLQGIIDNFKSKNEEKPLENAVEQAKKAERERILALNSLKIKGNDTINALIDEAIADETATAEAIKPYIDKIAQNVGAKNIVQDTIKDYIDGGAGQIKAMPSDDMMQNNDDMKTQNILMEAMKNELNVKYGGK